jgi:DsbC/DsbD-like thiol-disulfide interchange protein
MLRVIPALLIATLGVIFLLIPMAWAQDASAWDAGRHSAARLIAGSIIKTDETTFLRAGVELRLDAGWRTYWRDPGDSGIPPTFDFTGSQNIKSVTILWPALERFPDGAGGFANGYKGNVILPLRVIPLDTATSSSIHLKFGYDICENMCVPAEADLALDLTGSDAEEAAIERAELRVPRPVPLGNSKGLAIRSVHHQRGDGYDRVTVEVAAPEGAPVNFFVEGSTPGWSLSLPKLTGVDLGTRWFTFDLENLPADANAESAVFTFTAVSGDDAIEVATHLD